MGRSWPQPGEPLFLQEDTDLALAWQAELAGMCQCGHSLEESTSPENEGAYKASGIRCHACAEQARAVRAWQGDLNGLYFPVIRS